MVVLAVQLRPSKQIQITAMVIDIRAMTVLTAATLQV